MEEPREISIERLDEALVVVGIRGWSLFCFFSAFALLAIFWAFSSVVPVSASGKCLAFDLGQNFLLRSQNGGIVRQIFAVGGDSVEKGETLLLLEDSYGEEEALRSPVDGTVLWVYALEGERAEANAPLLNVQGTFDPAGLIVFAFIPLEAGERIHPGMDAFIDLDIYPSSAYGSIRGKVQKVLPYPVEADEYYMQKIPSKPMRDHLLDRPGAEILVLIAPELDPNAKSGLAWTSPKGASVSLESISLGEAKITLDRIRAISLLLPSWGN